ncbi:MAG: anaerobic ribonucleoside-triphosphate reductase activating protein [Acidaminococcaceae bacterium]|jgi:anaerobic ribonucleoside-triphosphate reductase activating protein|nr:anaerobic ribonucleoside-triphosphate reductase activating protein [Acidaminococcaceae bacterium]
MSTVRISGSKKHSSVNGPGVRYVLFFQGCPHHCPGCQNPETHDPVGGTERNVADVIQEILQTKYLDGLTFSGGDPLLQPEAVIEIARAAKNAGLNIWLYTGWTFEQIQKGAAGEKAKEALTQLDVLVDGPFVEKLKTGNAIWRGSDNQRLIDVERSLAEGSVIELPESKVKK